MADHPGGVDPDMAQRVAILTGMASMLKPSAIRAFATLRLADVLASGARTAEEVAAAAGTDAANTGKLLRYVSSLGILERAEDETFTLTALGELLRSDVPVSMRAMLSADHALGHADQALVALDHTIRTGEPCHEQVFGMPYWHAVNDDPRIEIPAFMSEQLHFDGDLILDEYPWEDVKTVVDVGGNTGGLVLALLRRHTHLHGTVVDLANTVEVARRHIAASGMSDRADAVVADFFTSLPPGKDVYVLSGILADWDDERSVALLRRCGEAAGEAGRILLADVNVHLQGLHSKDEAATGMDLWMASMVPSPVRTVDELVALATEAGLEVTWQGPVTPVRSLLELRQPR